MMDLRHFSLLSLLLLLSGCISPQRDSPVPAFSASTRAPVTLQIMDRRPVVQQGTRFDPDWIYFQQDGVRQADLLSSSLGNALTVLNACPGYVVLDRQDSIPSAGVVIWIEYLDGYARWPTQLERRGRVLPVEAATRIRYKVFANGRGIRQGSLEELPEDFRVPVEVISEANVDRIITEALAHQFNQATNGALDQLLRRLAKAWEDLPDSVVR
jgi:hypothetical protein